MIRWLTLWVLLSVSSAALSAPVTLGLRISSDDGGDVDSATVSISGKTFELRGESPVVTATKSRLYQLVIEAEGYFPSRQTFSDHELQRWNYQLPPISLVRRKPGRVLLAFGGDVMLGRRYHQPNPGEPRHLSGDSLAADAQRLLDPISPYLRSADLASINLESVVVAQEPPQHAPKSVVFHSPPETLSALEQAGIDYVSLGNNHSYDYLDSALEETIDRLDASSLGFSGAGLDEQEALAPWTTAVGDVAIAYHGFVGWAGRVEPNQVAEGSSKGGAALGSEANIRASLLLSPEDSVRVVQYHGSAEYSFAPTAETRIRARAAIDGGADLVIGHHPHVLHGVEVYKGKLIAYSLGNFLFDQYIYETQRSALLYVWMDGETFHRAEMVPLYIKGYRPTPAVDAVRNDVLRRLAEQARREGTPITYSGGHAVFGAAGAASPMQSLTASDGAPVGIHGWEPVTVPADCQGGWDWWALGSYEQEGLFGIGDYGWTYSSNASGIAYDAVDENYRVALHFESEAERKTSLGQKYFARTWNDEPKSVVFQVRTSVAVDAQVCLEMRGLDQSTAEGRSHPQVRCLEPQPVDSGDHWQQLSFDYIPPPRESLRGLRFRINFKQKGMDVAADAEQIVEVDDLQLISWTDNPQDRRINVLRCP